MLHYTVIYYIVNSELGRCSGYNILVFNKPLSAILSPMIVLNS